jgi:RNA polymerase sigma-70 factor (ECF subfamily)
VKPTAAVHRRALDDRAIDRIRRILYLNGLRGADVDDGVQEVRLRILERAPDGLGSLEAWAAVVATNLAIDRGRADRRRAQVVDRLRLVTAEAAETPDFALRTAMEAALARLDADLRAVVVLRFYADLSADDIAAQLAVPAGTVKSRLHRAVAELRRALPPEED